MQSYGAIEEGVSRLGTSLRAASKVPIPVRSALRIVEIRAAIGPSRFVCRGGPRRLLVAQKTYSWTFPARTARDGIGCRCRDERESACTLHGAAKGVASSSRAGPSITRIGPGAEGAVRPPRSAHSLNGKEDARAGLEKPRANTAQCTIL